MGNGFSKISLFEKRMIALSKNLTTKLAIIGGGPAGLMAAEVGSVHGLQVELFDAKPSVGRKFLVAGKGGLNLTHAEPFDDFIARYGERRAELEPILRAFGPDALRSWLHELGFETYVGSSGRVFPKIMQAGPILHAWVSRLRAAGVVFHTHHKWLGWGENGSLRFSSPRGETRIERGAIVFALGGGSWPQLGSTGEWIPLFKSRGLGVVPLKPANCGFNVDWTEHFRKRYAGQPVKPVILSFMDSQGKVFQQQGEFIITAYGLEGNLIYAASAYLRDEIESQGQAMISLDLAPDWQIDRLVERLARPRGSRSLSSHLKKATGLAGLKAGLLWEFLPREDFADSAKLATAIKHLAIPLESARPLAESISSSGGLKFEELDQNLMLHRLPGVFCAGEMLDWEAPTGGYLLTACFAMGVAAGKGAVNWLSDRS
jgi:uncharacterized flavoprotein (TIGR03862 family)